MLPKTFDILATTLPRVAKLSARRDRLRDIAKILEAENSSLFEMFAKKFVRAHESLLAEQSYLEYVTTTLRDEL